MCFNCFGSIRFFSIFTHTRTYKYHISEAVLEMRGQALYHNLVLSHFRLTCLRSKKNFNFNYLLLFVFVYNLFHCVNHRRLVCFLLALI